MAIIESAGQPETTIPSSALDHSICDIGLFWGPEIPIFKNRFRRASFFANDSIIICKLQIIQFWEVVRFIVHAAF